LFLVAMAAGSALIAANSLVYFDVDAVAPFVVERLPEQFASVWLAALRIHVGAALLSLPLCLALMTRWLRRRPSWHRWIGRVTVGIILLALVPTGIVLAFHAKGGAFVTAGFLLSAAIVAASAVRGVAAARRRPRSDRERDRPDMSAHQRAMRHVFGQMSVAVTSRALLLGFDALGVDPGVAYVVALWGPVLATAAIVEVLSLPSSVFGRRRGDSNPERVSHREMSALGSVVRVRSLLRPFARLGR
jgi:hypothetical protein